MRRRPRVTPVAATAALLLLPKSHELPTRHHLRQSSTTSLILSMLCPSFSPPPHRPIPCFERWEVSPEDQLSAIPAVDEPGVQYWSSYLSFEEEADDAGAVVPVRLQSSAVPCSRSALWRGSVFERHR